MRRNSLPWIALLGVIALGATACGSSNPAPAPLPSASASRNDSASPSVEAVPTMPPEAKGTSAAAAKAFVKHYLAVFSYATRTGDVGPLTPLALKECVSCNGVSREISKIYKAGGRAEGRGFSVDNISVNGPDARGDVKVTLSIIALPQTVYRSKGASPKHTSQTKTPAVFWLRQADDGWVIREWTRV